MPTPNRERPRRVNYFEPLFCVYTKYKNDIFDVTDDTIEYFEDHIRCRVCLRPSPEWEARRKPIHVVIKAMPRASIDMAGLVADIWKSSLVNLLRRHLAENGAVIGRCEVLRRGKPVPTEDYLTVYCPIDRTIEADRGRYCRHRMCDGCGRIFNNNAWACGAVLKPTLDQRQLYFSDSSTPIVTKELMQVIQADGHFSDLRFQELDVVDRPLDGDTLPGDPGWDGVLKARRMPRVPKRMPDRYY